MDDGGARGAAESPREHDPAALFEAGLGEASAPSAAEMAQHFTQFELLEVLGQGGMGIVYRARQKSLDRIVALKVLTPPPGNAAEFAERFQREARALARLEHPHIVRVYEHGTVDGLHYLVMEYVDGVTLRAALREGRLAPEQALRIVPQICDALQAAHDHGIVHRDIKPENVLIAKDGGVKIADFGLARLVEPGDTRLTRRDQVMGTLHYMAPEQFESPGDVDHRADIYSLGVVLYEMLTGELPIGRFETPSERAAVDARLDEVVLRALEKRRERRYQKADEFRSDMDVVAAGGVPAPRRPGAPHTQGPPVPLFLAKCALAATPLGIAALVTALIVAEANEASLGPVGHEEVWLIGGGAAAICAAFGVVAGAIAWLRIGLGRGRYTGLRAAVAGTLLPVLLAPVVGPTAIMLENAMRPPYAQTVSGTPRSPAAAGVSGLAVYYGPEDQVLRDEVADAATNLFLRARAHAARGGDDVLGTECAALYGEDAVAKLRALSPEQFAEGRRRGAFGLALVDTAELRLDLRRMSPNCALLDSTGARATVRAFSDEGWLRFSIVRPEQPEADAESASGWAPMSPAGAQPAGDIGAWRLEVSQVEEEPGTSGRWVEKTLVTGVPARGGTRAALDALATLLERAVTHAIARRDLDGVDTLYTSAAYQALVLCTPEERERLGRERRLGLALLTEDSIDDELAAYAQLASVTFDDTGRRAVAVLKHGAASLAVRCALEGSEWRLVAEPVALGTQSPGEFDARGRRSR